MQNINITDENNISNDDYKTNENNISNDKYITDENIIFFNIILKMILRNAINACKLQ